MLMIESDIEIIKCAHAQRTSDAIFKTRQESDGLCLSGLVDDRLFRLMAVQFERYDFEESKDCPGFGRFRVWIFNVASVEFAGPCPVALSARIRAQPAGISPDELADALASEAKGQKGY